MLTGLEVATAAVVLVAEAGAEAGEVTVDKVLAVATEEVVATTAMEEAALVVAETAMVAAASGDAEVAIELLLVSEDVLLSPTHMPTGRLKVRKLHQ